MIRRIFSIATVLSLLVSAATAAVWVLGMNWQAWCDSILIQVNGRNWLQHHRVFLLSDGRIEWEMDDVLGQNQQVLPDARDGRWQFWFERRDAADEILTKGLRPLWRSGRGKPTAGMSEILVVRYQQLDIPCWCLIAIFGILPVAWLMRRRRQKSGTAHNRCLVCGYDLRASTERCPECGTPILGKATV